MTVQMVIKLCHTLQKISSIIIISYGMLKVKTFDPNQTFGAEFGDPHLFHSGAHNIYVDYIFKKKFAELRIKNLFFQFFQFFYLMDQL